MIYFRRLLSATGLTWLCLLLCCCGFHLRGSYNLPPQLKQVYVNYSDCFDPLILKINQTLLSSGISLAKQADQAKYILQINSITENSVMLSSSTTSQSSTYNMVYTIDFSLSDSNGRILLAPQKVSSTAMYTINSTQLLTNFSNQPTLLAGLQQDVIFQLMNHLSSNNAKKALL